MKNYQSQNVTFTPEVLQPSNHEKMDRKKKKMNDREKSSASNTGIPRESKAKRLTDFKGTQTFLLLSGPSYPFSATPEKSNCVTLGSCEPRLL